MWQNSHHLRGEKERERQIRISIFSRGSTYSIIKERKKRKTREQERRGLLSISRLRSVSCRFSHGFSRNRVSQLRCSYFPPLDKGGGRERERESSKIVVNLSWIFLPLSRGLRFFAWLTLQGCLPPPQRVFPELIRPENSNSVSQEIINNTFTFCSEIF